MPDSFVVFVPRSSVQPQPEPEAAQRVEVTPASACKALDNAPANRSHVLPPRQLSGTPTWIDPEEVLEIAYDPSALNVKVPDALSIGCSVRFGQAEGA